MVDRAVLARRLGKVAGPVIVVACLVVVADRLVDAWPEVRADVGDASWTWLAVAVAAGAGGMSLLGAGWERVLAALGHPVGIRRAVAWYFAGEIGKYLPGSVWSVLGRGELARRGGVPRAVAYQSVGLSLVVAYLAAAVLGGWLLGEVLALVVVVAVAAALHPAVASRVLRFVRRRTGRRLDLVAPPLATSLALVLVYLPAWLAIGAATWAVARALDPGAPLVPVVLATAAAWLVGFLAVPVPGGVGVREVVFVGAVSGLAPSVAIATAGIARVLFLLVDGVGATVGAAAVRGANRGTADADRGAEGPGPGQ